MPRDGAPGNSQALEGPGGPVDERIKSYVLVRDGEAKRVGVDRRDGTQVYVPKLKWG